MNDIKLDSNWNLDITTDPSDLQTISGSDAISQHCKQRLWTFRGEWFLDTQLGVGYYQAILKKAYDPVEVESEFLIAIANTPGIESIQSLELDLDLSTRELSLTFEAFTDTDLVDFSTTFTLPA